MNEGERARRKLLVALGLTALLAPPAYFAVRPLWQHWRHRQALDQARHFAGQHDHRNALLAYQRATQIAPSDIATWEEVARYLSNLGVKEALVARENLVNLTPNDAGARLALATEALRFSQPERAREALSGVAARAAATTDYHRLAAAIAMAETDLDALYQHLEALLEKKPDDHEARLNLAIVRLWNPDTPEAVSRHALQWLESLVSEPSVQIRASLELLKHAARERDADRAGAVVGLLLKALPPLPLGAGTAQGSGTEPAEWGALVGRLQQAAASRSPADVALLARWLGDVRRRSEALVWLDTLAPALRDSPAVLAVSAELAAEADDHPRLSRALAAGAWGHVPADAATLAIAAHIQRQRQRGQNGRDTWNDALAAAGNSSSALRTLCRLALIWHDDEGARDALLSLLGAQPRDAWAFNMLSQQYRDHGQTEKLWNLLSERARLVPEDTTTTAAWIRLACVLDRERDAVSQAAARLNSARASAHTTTALAAASWRAGEAEKALTQLMSLGSQVRARPETAFWLVVAGTAAGKPPTDSTWRQAQSVRWLAEEAALLRSAAEKAGRPHVSDRS